MYTLNKVKLLQSTSNKLKAKNVGVVSYILLS